MDIDLTGKTSDQLAHFQSLTAEVCCVATPGWFTTG
jgi:hypothetical protein